ncbi:MAG TPA: peptidase MA family metallohydrolase [Candidatus Latescibacteria bacterium]|nr:peptidase MA family metallohydrolase [Candidatus Latescibacterota bacterium]
MVGRLQTHADRTRLRAGYVSVLFLCATIFVATGAPALVPAQGRAAGNWEVTRFGGGLVIEHRPHMRASAERAAAIVQMARTRFYALADTSFPFEIHVLLASSAAEFAGLTRGLVPDWGAAAAVPGEGLVIISGLSEEKPMAEAACHEVAHLALHALSRGPVPRWFDEGIAMRLSDEWSIAYSVRLARSALANRLLPLHSVERVLSFERDQAALAYAVSFAAIRWFEKRHGERALALLLRSLASHPFDEAFERVTGSDSASFEREWLRSARHSYALVGLADDMWIWSILIPGLFFLALGVRWWRNRRTLARWKREDRDSASSDEPLDEHVNETY